MSHDPTSRSFHRVAVLGPGGMAHSLIRAARDYAAEQGLDLDTIALCHPGEGEPFWALEAAELVAVEAEPEEEPLAALERTLLRSRADALFCDPSSPWHSPSLDELCPRLGLVPVQAVSERSEELRGPEPAAALAEAARGAGLGLAAEPPGPGIRTLEVLMARDEAGTTWCSGPCELVTGGPGLSECPPRELPDVLRQALRDIAARLGRTLAFVGVVSLRFHHDPQAREVALAGISPNSRPEHTCCEMVSGLDLVRLTLHLARGGRLEGTPPAERGHAFSARLQAKPLSFALESGAPLRIERVRPPVGPGIRMNLTVDEGDLLDIARTLDVGTITALGSGPAEARARMLRALADTAVVLPKAVVNKEWLVDLLEAGTGLPGTQDRSRLAAAALVQAALESDEAAMALERGHFVATGLRGRPEVSSEMGRLVTLEHEGNTYRVRVERMGPGRRRLEMDGLWLDASANRPGADTGRLEIDGRRYRTVLVPDESGFTVEVEGIPHRFARDRNVHLTASFPAVVVKVCVKEGDLVRAGDPLVVVEAMKLETEICAEADGRVQDLRVLEGVQVGAGSRLLTLHPVEASESPQGATRLGFTCLGGTPTPTRSTLTELRSLILGFDAEARYVASAVETGARPEDPREAARLRRAEREVVRAFIDVASLRRREWEDSGKAEDFRLSPEETLLAYMRDVDSFPHLPENFQRRLRAALAHYGIREPQPGRELEVALYRIHRTHMRVEEQLPPLLHLLHRGREDTERSGGAPEAELQPLLDSLVAASRKRFPALLDAARELRVQLFDRPLLEAATRRAYEQAEEHLLALARDPEGPERAERIRGLVACSRPLGGLIAGMLQPGQAPLREALLETLARRYHRFRQLEDIRVFEEEGVSCLTAHYPHQGQRIGLVAALAEKASVAEAAARAAAVLARQEGVDDRALDLYTCSSEPVQDQEAASAEFRGVLESIPFPISPRRVLVSVSQPEDEPGTGWARFFTFRPDGEGLKEDRLYRGTHPVLGKRLELWQLSEFDLERLPSAADVYLYRGRARSNPKDERLFALAEVRDLTPVKDAEGRVVALPHLERVLSDAVAALRRFRSQRPEGSSLECNRVILDLWQRLDLAEADMLRLSRKLAPMVDDLGVEAVEVHGEMRDPRTGEFRPMALEVSSPRGRGVNLHHHDLSQEPVPPLTPYEQKVRQLRRRGLLHPYEILSRLAPPEPARGLPRGEFTEYDLDEQGVLVPVEQRPGRNTANIVVGLVRSFTPKHPEGMPRVAILGDPSRNMGSLAEPECRRIAAALDLAETLSLPVEWFALSAGAHIAMDSGTETMDWIAWVLRRIVEFTQAGGEVNVVVCGGVNVGAQPYWNAEATMLMHTRGILVMTEGSSMVLTGKRALDFSGGVSADDNEGIGGYHRIMGPNGQAQYHAEDVVEACQVLMAHYDHTYVVPGERFPRRAPTTDPIQRNVEGSPHEGPSFRTVGEIFSDRTNPDRKKPFSIRSVMRAVMDLDHLPLERWRDMRDAEMVVAWDAHLGGIPVCLVGLESHPIQRLGYVPADGPEKWTAGTFFPASSKKMARALNAASGNRPAVVLANLSGFDGSPESLRRWQLEYGAEIGRAVVNFRGPLIFCVVSRYHGGAFVVFSRRLNDRMVVSALEGTRASIIGGAPAAAVVFAREVGLRARGDERIKSLEQEIREADPAARPGLRARLEKLSRTVYAESLRQVADEYDQVHCIERARDVGSVQEILPARTLRPYLVETLERLMREEAPTRAWETVPALR